MFSSQPLTEFALDVPPPLLPHTPVVRGLGEAEIAVGHRGAPGGQGGGPLGAPRGHGPPGGLGHRAVGQGTRGPLGQHALQPSG